MRTQQRPSILPRPCHRRQQSYWMGKGVWRHRLARLLQLVHLCRKLLQGAAIGAGRQVSLVGRLLPVPHRTESHLITFLISRRPPVHCTALTTIQFILIRRGNTTSYMTSLTGAPCFRSRDLPDHRLLCPQGRPAHRDRTYCPARARRLRRWDAGTNRGTKSHSLDSRRCSRVQRHSSRSR